MERRIFVYSDTHSLTLLRYVKDIASVADFVIGLGDYTDKRKTERNCVPHLALEFTDVPLMGNHDTGAVRCGRLEVFGIRIAFLGGIYSPKRSKRRPRFPVAHDDRVLEKEIKARGRIQTERFFVELGTHKSIIENGPVGYEGYYKVEELEKIGKETFKILFTHTGPGLREKFRGDKRIEDLVLKKQPILHVHGHFHVLGRRLLGSTEVISLDREHGLIIKISDEIERFLLHFR